jgi:hypothetical protein
MLGVLDHHSCWSPAHLLRSRPMHCRPAPHPFAGVLFALSFLSALVPASHATTVLRMTDAEIVADSRWILEGRVISVSGAWNEDRTQIFTTVEIAVGDVLKGELAEKTVRLRMLGGSADGISMIVVGAPTFRAEEEVVLCLGANLHAMLPVVGLAQGKFSLTAEPSDGTKRVVTTGEERGAFLTRLRGLIGR